MELNKVYPVFEPDKNDPDSYVRVIDESEEDYIYLCSMFQMIDLPNQVHNRVLENLAA